MVLDDYDFIIGMQLKKQQQSIVYEQTVTKFKSQLQIIDKIMEGQLWIGQKKFPSAIIYQISIFVFHNPIKLKAIVYSPWIDRTLKTNQKYLLKARASQLVQTLQEKCQSKKQRSAYITVTKQWKALDTSQYGYAEVIQKGKLFLNFLSNIKIKLHPVQANNLDPLDDFDAYKKQQNEKKKQYNLISDHFHIVIKQFEEIYQYQKTKKISDVLIKAFVSLMNSSMAVVKIEENYDSNKIGCEGRYVYVANKNCLPFIKNEERALPENELKNLMMDSPWLQMDKNGEWCVGHSRYSGVNVYRQQKYPLQRGRKWLINRKLQYFLQNDVWISNI